MQSIHFILQRNEKENDENGQSECKVKEVQLMCNMGKGIL